MMRFGKVAERLNCCPFRRTRSMERTPSHIWLQSTPGREKKTWLFSSLPDQLQSRATLTTDFCYLIQYGIRFAVIDVLKKLSRPLLQANKSSLLIILLRRKVLGFL